MNIPKVQTQNLKLKHKLISQTKQYITILIGLVLFSQSPLNMFIG